MKTIEVSIPDFVPPNRYLNEYRARVVWERRKIDPPGERYRIGETIKTVGAGYDNTYSSLIVSLTGKFIGQANFCLDRKFIDFPYLPS